MAGVEEVELDFVVMTDDERAVLRQRLRVGMLGDGVPTVESDDDGHGHDHAGHGHGARAALPAFLGPDATPASSACRRARAASASRR